MRSVYCEVGSQLLYIWYSTYSWRDGGACALPRVTADTPQLAQFQSYDALRGQEQKLKYQRFWHARNKTKVAEEYCWAMTKTAGRSCCNLSGSSALEFGFQLDSLVYTYIVDHMHSKFRLPKELPQVSTCVQANAWRDWKKYEKLQWKFHIIMISDFRRDVDEFCDLLGYYAASRGNCLPTFRDNHLHGSRVRVAFLLGLLAREDGIPETSVNNYHKTPRNNPEDRRFHIIRQFFPGQKYIFWWRPVRLTGLSFPSAIHRSMSLLQKIMAFLKQLSKRL
jgi:hypothetical protein